jgi:hypothetical protein
MSQHLKITWKQLQKVGMKVDTCLEWQMQPQSSHRAFLHELLASTDTFNRKPIQSSWSNDAECLCCGDGGMLLLCDFCPASYHLECAGVEKVEVVFSGNVALHLLSRHVFLRFQLASGHAHTTPASNVSKQLKSAATVSSGN